MAQSMHRFEVSLADTDRSVYAELAFRLVRHPSETPSYLITRALALCICHEEGLRATAGICEGDEPALEVRDATQRRTHWVDVGRPGPAHVQRGLRDCERVSLLTTRPPQEVLRILEAADVRLLKRLEILGLDEALVSGLAEGLDRRNVWSVTVSGGQVYVDNEGAVLQGALSRLLGGGD
jgi:uncharacterized protein YaeQ